MTAPTTVAPPIFSPVITLATPIPPDGPLSTEAIAGITVGGVGGVAVLLVLVLLLIVLLWKYHSREGGKASTDSTPFTAAFESPNVDSIHMAISETYKAIHSQHIETHGNEAYQTTATAISTQPNTTYGGRVDDPNDYEEIAACGDRVDDQFADPTEHIETHGNEAYQTTANAISTQPNVAYGGQVDNRFDCEENAAYGDRVNNDYEENDAYGGRVDNDDNYEYIVPDYQ